MRGQQDGALREFVETFLRFESVTGAEADAQSWVQDQFETMGFQTYTWSGDPDRLAAHPSFPDDPAAITVADRPSVGGVLEFGNPEAGPTIVLNGHVDVVPATETSWSTPPFEPAWSEDGDRLQARGAADMKASLGAMVFGALDVRDRVQQGALDLDGRVVVESVVDEEAGGLGAAMAAIENPYPFERDGAIVGEPTELRPVTATEGCLMKQLSLTGRSAHAARRWRGESVIPHFIAIYEALTRLETERADRVTHPLYERFENPWPVNVGRVEAGDWASSVPASLTAEIRIGVAPGESVAAVETTFDECVAAVVEDRPWLQAHPPAFERFSVQFEPATVDSEDPIVAVVQSALDAHGFEDTAPRGETYGADNRHFLDAGIPTVVFGPGSIDEGHFPNESISWQEVEAARSVFGSAVESYLGDRP